MQSYLNEQYCTVRTALRGLYILRYLTISEIPQRIIYPMKLTRLGYNYLKISFNSLPSISKCVQFLEC
jgi:hypothetical protein